MAVAEVPLYFETGWQTAFTPRPHVVGVHCPLAVRARRIEENRGWTKDKVEAIEGWQWDEKRKMAACDTVVNNDGSLEALQGQAEAFLAALQGREQEGEQALAQHLDELWR